jgi:hypothetical protein
MARQDPASRIMRQAVAFDRLAAKAYRAGSFPTYRAYAARSNRLKQQAHTMRTRAQESDRRAT